MAVPRITREATALLVVDTQERLVHVIDNGDAIVANAVVAIRAARALDLPVLLTEQYPKGLGVTVPQVVSALGDAYRPVEKTSFSACGAEPVVKALRDADAESVVIVGIEAHVCVLQTAIDLLERGYNVFPVANAISSRTSDNRALGLDRMRQSGAVLISTEMLIFELLGDARDPHFKTLQSLIK
ncbi:hydrolase [Candidatus Poribacteria bacterium]|jgi:nicotinamidase-related amidase|nr:hydrolase [Candidatus Poribacteria bacterium]MBT5712634.1 hydrolase [Candidatus Poribacteria bacterium]MBT7096838.1 hydrolase [Candidatus Poribacteria bacterium]MBT7808038.1 hydrolase [Candidatus Poribacteria bacterium]